MSGWYDETHTHTHARTETVVLKCTGRICVQFPCQDFDISSKRLVVFLYNQGFSINYGWLAHPGRPQCRINPPELSVKKWNLVQNCVKPLWVTGYDDWGVTEGVSKVLYDTCLCNMYSEMQCGWVEKNKAKKLLINVKNRGKKCILSAHVGRLYNFSLHRNVSESYSGLFYKNLNSLECKYANVKGETRLRINIGLSSTSWQPEGRGASEQLQWRTENMEHKFVMNKL